MIIIGVIMHHYTRGGRFHFIEGEEESSSSALASPQSSLSLAPVVGKSLPLDNHHYLDHHQPSSLGVPSFAAQLRINIVSVLVIIIPIEIMSLLNYDPAYDYHQSNQNGHWSASLSLYFRLIS